MRSARVFITRLFFRRPPLARICRRSVRVAGLVALVPSLAVVPSLTGSRLDAQSTVVPPIFAILDGAWEQGRTEYIVRSPDSVTVHDFVVVEGTDRLFAEAVYHRAETEPDRVLLFPGV